MKFLLLPPPPPSPAKPMIPMEVSVVGVGVANLENFFMTDDENASRAE